MLAGVLPKLRKNGDDYEVLWTHPTGNKYDVWKVDASGNFVSSIKAKLWEDELKFNVRSQWRW